MIRIVGIQRGQTVGEEFVLVQNQGVFRVNLRGHALLGELALDRAYVLSDDVELLPSQFAVIRTGIGPSRWTKCPDGGAAYYIYLGLTQPIWCGTETINLLAPQHSFTERRPVISLA